jgi:dipeptidyl aminopeptidase/acylaminoacyl peptidase
MLARVMGAIMGATMKAGARCLIGALVLCGLALSARAAAPNEVALRRAEAYGRLPHVIIPELSPDGDWIASLEPVNGRNALVVRPRATPASTIVAFARDRGRLSWFAWASSQRLLVEWSFSGFRGTPTVETRMYAVNRDGSEPVMLLTPGKKDRTLQSGSLLTSILPHDPAHVLMSWDGDFDGTFSLYRVDLRSGRAEEIERGNPNVYRWLADESGRVRLRIDAVGSHKEIWVRDVPPAPGAEGPPWRLLKRYDMLTEPLLEPRFIAPDNPDLLYALAQRDGDRVAAFAVDLKTGALGPALFSDPVVDVDAILQARDGHLVGFLTVDDMPAVHYVDPVWRERQSAIDANLPATRNFIVSASDGGRYQLVVSVGSREPGRYYLREETTGALTLIGRRFPGLSYTDVSEVVPWSYRARDGLVVPAYLTLPEGFSLASLRGAKRPLIVFPHGGPSSRTSQGFDFMAQFMASLGYVVLQPNFRGSTGYGRRFQKLGHRQWGRAMQDDITDGVLKLVADGVADPARICIVGASYGGYAALMGAVRTPELYACAASIEGIADLKRYVSDLKNYRYAEIRVPPIADPGATDSVAGVSPIEGVAAIKAPVLLIHGDEDAIVPAYHSADMAKALRRQGKRVEHHLLEGGDHQLSEEAVRIEALRRLGAFLLRHLGPVEGALIAEPRA